MTLADLLGQPLDFWIPLIGSMFALAAGLALRAWQVGAAQREAARTVRARMRTLALVGGGEPATAAKADLLDRFTEPLLATDMGKRFRAWCELAQPNTKPSRIIALLTSLPLLGVCLGLYLHAVLSGLVIGLVGDGVMILILKRGADRETQRFADQLPEVFATLGMALRAGQSLSQAIGFAARQLDDPAAKEFARMSRELRAGSTLGRALQDLRRRKRSPDLDLAISAILMQSEVGGNLAFVLDNLAATIRTRRRVERDVRIATQQVRSTVYIVGALVPGLALLVSIENPGYLDPLFQPGLGLLLLLLAALGDVAGVIWTWRISSVRY